MDAKTLNKILSKRGQFTALTWKRKCKTYKGVEDIIEKETSAHTIRIGCSYDNLRTTIEGRENGTLPVVNAGLNGLEWKQYPILLVNPKTGKEFVRVELAENSKFVTTFYENSEVVEKNSILDKLTAAEKSSCPGERPTVMNIPLDSIISIS